MTLLVPLAGCSGSVPRENRQNPTEEATFVVEQETVSETTTSSQIPEGTSERQIGLNDSMKESVQSVLANFSEKLPENKSERRVVLLDTADSVCNAKRTKFNSTVNLSRVEGNAKEGKKAARRLQYSSEIVNEWFTGEVPVVRFQKLRDGADTATKYAPVLGSVQRFMEASCTASENRADKSIRKFQIAAMMVGVDIILASSGVGYRPAFAGTRKVMNTASQLGLYRIRYVCGNRCWALAWSETHWILRGEMIEGIHQAFVRSASGEYRLTPADIGAVAEKQQVNKSQMKTLSKKLAKEGMKTSREMFEHIEGCISGVNFSDAAENPEEAAEDAQDQAEDVASDFFGDDKNSSDENTTSCSGSGDNQAESVALLSPPRLDGVDSGGIDGWDDTWRVILELESANTDLKYERA